MTNKKNVLPVLYGSVVKSAIASGRTLRS